MDTDYPLAVPERETPSALAAAGQAANDAATRHVFDDYRARRAAHTLRRQAADLALFRDFLASVGLPTGDLQSDPDAWHGLTWGLVAGFVRWMLGAGYAVGSVNIRLSSVKTLAKLAFQAGAIDAAEHALIRTVTGYTHKEGRQVDEKRQAEDVRTRRGRKKDEAVRLGDAQARRLKREHPDTPQGRRDALLMSLLLDHGLRCGEVAGLQVGDLDLKTGELRFYRPKVDKVQTHRLTPDTLWAGQVWFDSGALAEAGMTERAITKRVRALRERVGIDGLSAHDCRHWWATKAARSGTDPFALQEAGGWNSLAMPRRYVEAAWIANAGVVLE